MLEIPGYQIFTKIHEGSNSRVYRGIRQSDQLPIVLKILKKDYPTAEEITRYKLEYQITCSLTIEGVIQAYDLQQYHNTFVIFLEDFGGESLEKLMLAKPFNIVELVELAIKVSEALGRIHAANVIHRDISPANIVFNSETKQVKIIDFGISTILPQEKLILSHPHLLEGTLAYMSPEQTGRMNRSLDYRTDFYSFGATLYYLFTHQFLFQTTDPLEMLHCHIAVQPIAPNLLNPAIPQPVSEIVRKLLAKNAEDRYQSAWGIKADLERCLAQLQGIDPIEQFPLAQHDISDKFQIPEKLYGRQPEVQALLAAFDRVSGIGSKRLEETKHLTSKARKQTASEVMLVSGYSGIGKSALVHEIYKPITQQKGYFISGKFDQYQRNIPYFAIAQALQELVKQLLTESDAQLTQWRGKLQIALGVNGQVVMQLVPSLELLIGLQPEVPVLPPLESQNRFNLVFQNLIQIFAQPTHPLVIFLDDLQWADPASLKLIQRLATSAEPQALLMIGAYRNNEVSSTHPLMAMLDEIRTEGATVNQIALGTLRLADVNQLIADTLHCQPEQSLPLAELVQLKTGGNPFFMNEFLKSLYATGLFAFDYAAGSWQWSMEQIQAQKITDNVVDLIVSKLQRFSPQIRQSLQVAACIGNQFELETLTVALGGNSQQHTALILREAIAEGLILPLSQAYKSVELDVPLPADRPEIQYKFAHDRIQQAAYSLIPEADRKALHRQVGQRLLQNTPVDQQEQKIFDITNHLNLGKDLIPDQAERVQLAGFNRIAGEKAKDSGAYATAFQYFQQGLDLLSCDRWQTQYELTLALYSLAAEATYLDGQLDQMEQFVAIVLEQAQTIEDKIKVYEVKIQAFLAQGLQLEGLQLALQALAELGISFPEQPAQVEIEQALTETRSHWQNTQISNLIDLPLMTDPKALVIMRLLSSALSAAHAAAPALFPLVVFKQVSLSIEYGNSNISPFSYGVYGLILAGIFLDIDAGYAFSQLALKLLERLNAKQIAARTLLSVHAGSQYWKDPLRDTLKPLQACYQIGIETGDLEFAGYTALHYCDQAFFMGMVFPELETKMADYRQDLVALKVTRNANAIAIFQQAVLNLKLPTQNPAELVGQAYDEHDQVPLLQQANDRQVLFLLYLSKLMVGYLFQMHEPAIASANLAADYIDGVAGQVSVAFFRFYDSLARLAVYESATVSDQVELLRQVTANQELMELWAHHAPMNYLHKWYLVEAERYRVLGQVLEAMDAYDRAIALAQENSYLQEEALANELAARFYLARAKTTIAKAYLQEARYEYLRWGAVAKVQDLEHCYVGLLEPQSARKSNLLRLDTSVSASSNLEVLDLATVLKASQAIAGEILLDKLLTKLMKILIENAGAQTGYLILQTQGEWRIEAIGSVDSEKVAVLQSIPLDLLEESGQFSLPTAIINYVARTQESIVLDNAAQAGDFTTEPWIVQNQSKSILCAPLLHQGELTGIVYLENNLLTSAFTPERIEMLHLLSAQAAIAIDNARLLKQQAELNESLRNEISERQRAETERDRLIAILEASIDHIGMADLQGNVLWNNTQARKIAGLPLEGELPQRNIPNYHPQWALEIIQDQGIPTALRDGIWVGETALLRADGSEMPVSQMIIAHKAADGRVKFMSTVMRDISTLKAAETEVRQLNAELEQRVVQRTAQLTAANKELESFSYSVSHDLRAPLRAIAGFSRLLQEDYGSRLDAEGLRYLKVLQNSAKRMGELIDDLLALSRLNRQDLYRQPIFLNDLIEQVLHDMELSLEGRQVEFAIVDLPICRADLSLMRQVWTNLLSNAIKYTQYKSVAHIEVGYKVMDDEVVYFIRDNGAGFDMRYVNNLFGVFQRLHRNEEFEGTGVGLAIVQRIIHRHGGRIWADATVNQGATFYFTLPETATPDQLIHHD